LGQPNRRKRSSAGIAPNCPSRRWGGEQRPAFINANLPGTWVDRTICQRDGRIECADLSPTIEALIGGSAAQFQEDASRAFTFVHPDDRLAFRENETRAIESASAAEITVRVRHPGGQEKWAQFRSQVAEVLGDGAHVRDGVVVDVTLEKSAENVRSVSERRDLALRASRTCIWENYVEAYQVTLDARWAEMRGPPSGSTVTTARELIALVHPDDRQVVFSASIRAIRGETDDDQVEQRIATAQGAGVGIRRLGRATARDEAIGRTSLELKLRAHPAERERSLRELGLSHRPERYALQFEQLAGKKC